MTWNPRTVFSGLSSAAEFINGDSSSSFDPSRTGDPIVPGHGGPAIGFGGTRLGGFSADPRRRPIGFAPPADEPAEPRYRTELSFRRHGSTPVASAMPPQGPGDEKQDVSEPWQTPAELDLGTITPGAPAEEAHGEEHVVVPDPHGDEDLFAEPAAVVPADGGAELDADPEEEKQPFYKREITFRRKRTESVEAPSEVIPEIAATTEPERAAEAPLTEAPTIEIPLHDESVAGTDAPVDAPGVEWPAVDEPVAAEHAAAETAAEHVIDEPFVVEPVLAEPVAYQHVSDEPVADEPVTDDLTTELPLLDIAAHHEPVAERPVGDEWRSDEPVAEETPLPLDPIPTAVAATSRRSLGRKRAAGTSASQSRPAGRKGRKLVGLKIGSSQLAAAVVVESDGANELVALARRPLADGIVVDGEVRDVDALAHALKTFFDEEKLPKKDVRIGLASNRIGVRTLDIVGIEDQSQFDNAVRFKAHEVLPVAVHESLLDYRVLEERPGESGVPSRRVLLVVAPRDQVEPYQEVASRAGLRLAGIDLEALGLLRAFVDPKPFAVRTVDDTATVVVAMGHQSSTLLVAGGGVCEFTRVFDWGGAALQDAIVQELDVHPAEAATILRHLSLSGPGRRFEGLDDDSRTKVLDAMRLRLTPFARELVSSLQFYQTQPDSLGIGEIVITGGTSHLEGLAEVLHQMIGVSVRVGDPLQRVVARTDIDMSIEGTIGSMAVPIGLAIDDGAVRSIDLLAGESKKPARRRPTLLAVAAPAAVVIPIAALALLFVQAHGSVSTQQSQLDATRSQIDALPTPTKPTIDASLASDQAARATAVASVLGSRFAWETVFRDLSLALPKNVWLEHVVATVPAPTDPAAIATVPTAGAVAQGVTIEGFTYTQPDVARLLARLATLPTLTNVSLQSSAAEKLGTRDVVHFTLLADLVNGGSR
jgi:type IV pilus assembly protein PilM